MSFTRKETESMVSIEASEWTEESVVTFRMGLKQSNLEHAYDYLMNVSHPSSPHYGRLWTPEEVRETFAPSKDSVDAVNTWLESAGIEDVVYRKGWVSFQTTVYHAEELLQSKYYEHEDLQTGDLRIGCDQYAGPS